ncbi:lysostaphin resistance A-like protein [Arenimonas sp.]|uniref:CPBP family intramembrane glutamic endopeptidase n=1 Tax=Arenimonas sp. TaxID=1872635 RepID=UPI0039E649DA
MTPIALFSPEPARGWLPWVWLAPILLIVFVAAPVIALDGWMQAQHWSDARGYPIGLAGLYALLWFTFAPTLLLVLAWTRWIERRPIRSLGFVAPAPLKTFLQGVAIGVGTITLVVFSIWAAGGLRAEGWGSAWRSPASLLHIALLLPSFALQSSVEEIIFRGWLLSTVARKASVWLAVLLVSLVFTFLHYSPHQPWLITMSSFLFSLFACAWVLRTGNIWGAMGWHTGWNWWLATGFELPVTGIDAHLPALLVALRPQGMDALTGGAEGPEGSFLCVGFFVVGIAWIAWRRRRATVSSLQVERSPG